MTLFEELQARGLLAQLTDEEEIKELINNGKATFYIGFDPTADSLHVGHFMALCLMKRLQMAGNKPIALIGGGTAMIGDPSGRTDMRTMMTREQIQHNCDCFKAQMSKFIDFSDGKALLVNNGDWYTFMNIEFHFNGNGGEADQFMFFANNRQKVKGNAFSYSKVTETADGYTSAIEIFIPYESIGVSAGIESIDFTARGWFESGWCDLLNGSWNATHKVTGEGLIKK